MLLLAVSGSGKKPYWWRGWNMLYCVGVAPESILTKIISNCKEHVNFA